MASRTEIICLHEGEKGRSIDPVFINRLIRSLKPAWIKQAGSNMVRLIPKGGRSSLIDEMPAELTKCLSQGGQTTLMVWADMDHDMADGDKLKAEFWKQAELAGITQEQFDQVVFIFAKDRLENWIQYLNEGSTDEAKEGPRVKDNRLVAEAARKLAKRCQQTQVAPPLPPSLQWSCRNWRKLVDRMRTS